MAMPPTDFDAIVLTHLDAAFNLATWLLRDSQAAEDVVQDAMVRALTYFRGYKGENARAWVLQIVRNAAFEYLRKRQAASTISIEGLTEDGDRNFPTTAALIDTSDTPEAAFMRERSREEISRAIEQLPLELRECIVLREFEELSYKEISQVTGSPIGTIMSRLWRARQSLLQALLAEGY